MRAFQAARGGGVKSALNFLSADGKQRREVAHFMLWGADVGMHGRFIRRPQVHDPHKWGHPHFWHLQVGGRGTLVCPLVSPPRLQARLFRIGKSQEYNHIARIWRDVYGCVGLWHGLCL